MPGLTGVQLVGLMHEIRADLPVIICTGFSDGIDSDELARHSIEQLFIKPVPSQKLLQAVSDILAREAKTAQDRDFQTDGFAK